MLSVDSGTQSILTRYALFLIYRNPGAPSLSPFTTSLVKSKSLRGVQGSSPKGAGSDILSLVIIGGYEGSRKYFPLTQARGVLALTLYFVIPCISQTQKSQFTEECMAMVASITWELAFRLDKQQQQQKNTQSTCPGNQHLPGPREMLFHFSCAVSLKQKAIVPQCQEGWGFVGLLAFEMDTT